MPVAPPPLLLPLEPELLPLELELLSGTDPLSLAASPVLASDGLDIPPPSDGPVVTPVEHATVSVPAVSNQRQDGTRSKVSPTASRACGIYLGMDRDKLIADIYVAKVGNWDLKGTEESVRRSAEKDASNACFLADILIAYVSGPGAMPNRPGDGAGDKSLNVV